MEPSVFIGLTVCNNAMTLPRAMSSVLEQDFSQWILNVIDSDSDDGSFEMCLELAATDDRIRVHSVPRQTWYENARLHVSNSTETYTTWLDADDWLAPNYLSLLVEALDRDPSLIAAAGSVVHVVAPHGLRVAHLANGLTYPWMRSGSRCARRVAYVAAPEAKGKTNVLYGLWRTDQLQGIGPWNTSERAKHPAGDVFFVYRALKRGPIASVSNAIRYRSLRNDQVPAPRARLELAGQSSLMHFLFLYGLPRSWAHEYHQGSSGPERLMVAPVIAIRLGFQGLAKLARILRIKGSSIGHRGGRR